MATETSPPALEEQTLPSSPKEDEDEISILDLLIVIAERKAIVFKITVVGAVLAVVVSLLLPQRYTATVLLMPPQQNSSLGAQLASQFGSLGGMMAMAGGSSLLKSPNDMFVSMFRSRTVEDAMIQHFSLMKEYHAKFPSDARKAFEHYSTVDGKEKDGLIRISMEDSDPRRAAELANGYVDQFRELSEHLAITEAAQRRLFFEQQMEKAKDQLADAEAALTATEQKTGLIQIDSQARALIESAAQLRAQIAAKEVQIEGMQTYATGENSQLIQARQELDGLRAQLARLGGNEDIPGSGILPAKGQMTASGTEYVRRLRDVKYYETIFDILARQYEVAKLDEARQGALIQVVDPATPPDRRSFPKRGMIVIAATFICFLIGVLTALALAFFQNLRNNSKNVLKLEQLRHALGLYRRRFS